MDRCSDWFVSVILRLRPSNACLLGCPARASACLPRLPYAFTFAPATLLTPDSIFLVVVIVVTFPVFVTVVLFAPPAPFLYDLLGDLIYPILLPPCCCLPRLRLNARRTFPRARTLAPPACLPLPYPALAQHALCRPCLPPCLPDDSRLLIRFRPVVILITLFLMVVIVLLFPLTRPCPVRDDSPLVVMLLFGPVLCCSVVC